MSMWAIGITVATTAISLAGTAVAVVGQRNAAEAAEDAASFNAKLQLDQANQEQVVAAENARRKATEEKRIMASIVAGVAGAGFSIEGTPLEVLGDTSEQLQRDILDIGFEAANRRRSLKAGAYQSLLDGENTATSLRNQSIATGLQGVGSAVGSYGKAMGGSTGGTSGFLT